MKEVTELVLESGDFAVEEQGLAGRVGRGDVRDDDADVRGAIFADEELVHPGAGAFGFAGEEVGIEAGEGGAGFIINAVGLDLGGARQGRF